MKKKENVDTSFKFDFCDFEPSRINTPDKYYTVKMTNGAVVSHLDEGDIAIIDPSKRDVFESGIYIFECKGVVLIRQFQVMPFKYEKEKGTVYRSVGCYAQDYFRKDEVNIIGAIIGKHVEIFPNLYNGGGQHVYRNMR